MKKNLYDDNVYQDCLRRIEQLSAESKPDWGTMSSAQMLAHCAEIQEVANGKELKNTPFFVRLFRGVIRRMVLSDKPFPRSTQTHPQYIIKDDRDFETEKNRLMAAMKQFAEAEGLESRPHAIFGPLTRDEKGTLSFKHLDHHLVQFSV